MKRTLLLLTLPILYLYFVGKIFNVFVADLYAVQSGGFLEKGETEDAHDYINNAIDLNSNEPSYFRQRAKILLAKKILLRESDKTELENKILEDLLAARRLNGKNLATLRNSLPLYYFWSGTSGFDSLSHYDNQKRALIRGYFSEMKQIYAKDLGMLADIAKNERKLGFNEGFAVTRGMAESLRPDVVEWHEGFK